MNDNLLCDKLLSVIERVQFGKPVEWCHHMVVTLTHDGSPRWTVDLSLLNKHCKRETHNVELPFHLAIRIPPNTWQRVTEAWKGYHSVSLRESDRHLTTFVTPFGRWPYKKARQGFLSFGNGCNGQCDAILSDFDQKEHIVDDTIFYDNDLEEAWWRTIGLLATAGRTGIFLNPSKF